MWNMTERNTHIFICWWADPIDVRKLVFIQIEIKREKELYKRPNCFLQSLQLSHSLWIQNWLLNFHCDLTKNEMNSSRNPV